MSSSFISKSKKNFLRATAGTAIARLSHRNSVCPSHGWISQKRCKLDHQIFAIGCMEDSSFRTSKAFP